MKLIERYGCLGLALLGLTFLMMGKAFAVNLSPVGYWAARSDQTGHRTGIVRIWQQQGRYYGRVVKIYSVDDNQPTARCVKCRGDYYNKPILGMVVLYGIVNQGSYYGNGTILDPKNGEVYNVRLVLIDNGDKMHVHGYVTTPLFGRTQIWTRVRSPEQQ